MRGHGKISKQMRGVFHVRCNKMADWSLMLKLAVDNHQPGSNQRTSFFLGQIAPDDDVGVAGFVFQRDEGDAAGCAGALATGNKPCHGCMRPEGIFLRLAACWVPASRPRSSFRMHAQCGDRCCGNRR